MKTRLAAGATDVVIETGGRTVMIGERINPTGRPGLAEALRAGDFTLAVNEAEKQLKAGAEVLDLNAGLPEADEVALLPALVKAVSAVAGAPLCLDSDNPRALEAGLAACPGRALINSVTGETASLAAVLPLAREYNAAVIGLTMDDEGIPKSSQGRLRIAERMVQQAVRAGLSENDLIIDCLAMSLGADQRSGLVSLEAIRLVNQELGLNQTLGGSNVSFGLPGRTIIDSAFLSLAISAGVTCPIVDPLRVGRSIGAVDLILGRDKYAKRYTSLFRSCFGK